MVLGFLFCFFRCVFAACDLFQLRPLLDPPRQFSLPGAFALALSRPALPRVLRRVQLSAIVNPGLRCFGPLSSSSHPFFLRLFVYISHTVAPLCPSMGSSPCIHLFHKAFFSVFFFFMFPIAHFGSKTAVPDLVFPFAGHVSFSLFLCPVTATRRHPYQARCLPLRPWLPVHFPWRSLFPFFILLSPDLAIFFTPALFSSFCSTAPHVLPPGGQVPLGFFPPRASFPFLDSLWFSVDHTLSGWAPFAVFP